MKAAALSAFFIALYVGHHVGDHWIQNSLDAEAKGGAGWPARLACTRHVLTLTLTKLVAVWAVVVVTDLPLSTPHLVIGLTVDAVSHYWADRRTTLAALAAVLPGNRDEFWTFGAPRPGHDDNPSIGTGAYALDQSWHIAWLFVAALIIAAGS